MGKMRPFVPAEDPEEWMENFGIYPSTHGGIIMFCKIDGANVKVDLANGYSDDGVGLGELVKRARNHYHIHQSDAEGFPGV